MKDTLTRLSAAFILFLTVAAILVIGPLTVNAQNPPTVESLEGTIWQGSEDFGPYVEDVLTFVFDNNGKAIQTLKGQTSSIDYREEYDPITRRYVMKPSPIPKKSAVFGGDTVCTYEQDGNSVTIHCSGRAWKATLRGNRMDGTVTMNEGTPSEKTNTWSVERVVSPYGEIDNNSISVDFDAYDDDTKGMRIHLSFTVGNLRDERCIAIAYFYYDSGEPLRALHEKFKAANGSVAVSGDFKPTHSISTYRDFQLFMPYNELAVPSGNYDLNFNVKLYCEKSGFLAYSEVQDFTIKKK